MSWFRRLTLAAAVLCFGVVVLGAYVRLSHAGLGCPDWPGCYGLLTVPKESHELAAAAQNYPERPVEAHKAWKEMVHRYFASALGLIIVGLAFASVRLRDQGAPRQLPWFLVGLVIFQGVLGMWTVTWQLKPLAVSAHLLGGMSTLALLAWMWLSTKPTVDDASHTRTRSERQVMLGLLEDDKRALAPFALRAFAALTLAVVALQIFLGGWTSSNYAALACPDFPSCHGRYWPEMDMKEAFTLWRGLGINYEGGVLDNRARVTIHFAHRLGALVVAFIGFALALVLWKRGAKIDRRLGAALAGALALQIGLGIAIVKLQLPLLLADMHNAGAAVLLLTLIVLNHSLWTVPRDRRSER
jgi:cytochrome c oxidase assembly protein subunit 15